MIKEVKRPVPGEEATKWCRDITEATNSNAHDTRVLINAMNKQNDRIYELEQQLQHVLEAIAERE